MYTPVFCVSAVRLCVPAVQRQRLRRAPEDLHSPAGLSPGGLFSDQIRVSFTPVSENSNMLLCFQVNGKSLSLKQYLEEPSSLSMVTLIIH